MLLQKTHFVANNVSRLKVREWKRICHANSNFKKAELPILICDKVDFRAKKITSHKGRPYIMIKGSICQEDIMILNVHIPNKSFKYT